MHILSTDIYQPSCNVCKTAEKIKAFRETEEEIVKIVETEEEENHETSVGPYTNEDNWTGFSDQSDWVDDVYNATIDGRFLVLDVIAKDGYCGIVRECKQFFFNNEKAK